MTRLLHLVPGFDPDPYARETLALIAALGPGLEHVIVPADAAATGALALVPKRAKVSLGTPFPPLTGASFAPRRVHALAQAMRGYDLVLTHDWECMGAVLAHTLLRDVHGLAPLVHHVDSLDAGENGRPMKGRNWLRRVALGRASALVVPDDRLEAMALGSWQQPAGRVHRVAHGVDVARIVRKPGFDALPRVVKRAGELWIGMVAPLVPAAMAGRAVRALARLDEAWQLVLVGTEDPAEADRLREMAVREGVAHRVHRSGPVDEPASVLALFDLFAAPGDDERLAAPVLEAMAAGLAIAATATGGLQELVAAENLPFLVAPGDEQAFVAALAALADDAALRRDLGAANRAAARGGHDMAARTRALGAIYARALGRALPG